MNLCGKCKHYQTSLCRRPFYGRNTLAPQGCFEAKKLTNYEKVKNMSIEEMANCFFIKGFCTNRGCDGSDLCEECIAKWLESEVEN